MKLSEQHFYSGIVCALAVCRTHDAETIYREIVNSISVDELITYCRLNEELIFSGLTMYGYVKASICAECGAEIEYSEWGEYNTGMWRHVDPNRKGHTAQPSTH